MVVELPSLRAAFVHSRWVLLEGMVVPFGLFYLMLLVSGVRGACIVGMGWSLAALGRRLVLRQRIPATLLMGTLLLAIRTAVTLATGSTFFYFAQPTVGTALVAVLFLVTAVVRRPIIERLAHDFCPLDPVFFRRSSVRRFFVQLSVLWGLVLLANAGFVMWLLLTTSVKVFVLERTLVSWVLEGGGILVSVVWFVRRMRKEHVRVRFSGRALAPERA